MGRWMIRWIAAIAAVTILLMVVFLPTQTHIDPQGEVELIFRYEEQDIRVTLTREESDKIVEILDGNRYDLLSGIPSCGFTGDVSLCVNGRRYAVACDGGCGILQDLGNLRFFSVTEEELAYIHGLFETYGGYFPCI